MKKFLYNYMPQFQPYLWINMLTWFFVIFSILLYYVHTNLLPNILKVKLARTYMLFNNIIK